MYPLVNDEKTTLVRGISFQSYEATDRNSMDVHVQDWFLYQRHLRILESELPWEKFGEKRIPAARESKMKGTPGTEMPNSMVPHVVPYVP